MYGRRDRRGNSLNRINISEMCSNRILRTPETNLQQIISATGYPIKMIRQIHIVVTY